MILDPLLDLFRGKAVTIPPLDGALRPNTALEDAEAILEMPAPDNLCSDGSRVYFSAGPQLFELPRGADSALPIANFDAAITALAASPAGNLAVALDDGRIQVGKTSLPPPGGLGCPTALAFGGADSLYVCQGSALHRASDWVVDLMEQNSTGSVWRIDLASGKTACLADGLAFPYGVLAGDDGKDLIVAESWRHRLLRLPISGGTPTPVLSKLPGYPARLAPAADGGAWLTLFAPRNRLIEFILQEQDYRAAMVREVPRDYWIAPALSSGRSFLEPLQCGGIKIMGIHKPWAPSRSYGLVARLDRAMQPLASFHSRSNGTRHGVTSVVESFGRILATAKGGNAILGFPSHSAGES